MTILPLHKDIETYLKKHDLNKKYEKQKRLIELNPFYPGLNTELLEPKEMKIWSFRIDLKYRAIFVFHNKSTIEIIDINNHYK